MFSGYSFKDEGVNALMSNWYNHTKRIVVIDPADNIETFKKNHALEMPIAQGWLHQIFENEGCPYIGKNFHDVEADDILRKIDEAN